MRILGLVLMISALMLAAVYRPPPREAVESTPQTSTSDVWTAPAYGKPDSGDLSPIAQRPLFQPQRRPPVAERVDEPAPDPPRIRLSAVTVSSDVRVAVIKEIDSGDTRRVREGEKLNHWTIKRVHPDQIVLQWKDKETTIPLFGGE